MKVSDAGAFYFDYTEKLDDRLRTLAITGIGIIWVFKQTAATGSWIPHQLFFPAGLFVSALVIDLIQLAYGTIAWGWLLKKAEGRSPESNIGKPKWLDWPTTVLKYSKILLILSGYILLVIFLKGRFA